jgi:hypothetical protein
MPLTVVPIAGQTLAASRDLISGNFVALNNAFLVDHVDFGLANQGKHNKISFPVQAVAPATGAAEVGLYCLTSALTGIPELSFRRNNSGAAYEFTSAGATRPGWTRLPSGILLKWGFDTPAAGGLNTYNFPVAANIPVFTQIFSILITTGYNNTSDGNGFVRLVNFTAPWASFRVYCSQRTSTTPLAVSYEYLAIGI